MVLLLLTILFVITALSCKDTSTTMETTVLSTTQSTTISTEPLTTTTDEPSTTISPTETIPKRIIDHVEVITASPQATKLVEIGLFELEGEEIIADLYNPYDYNQIKIVMTLTSPSETVKNLHAFWFKQYASHSLIAETYNQDGYILSGQERVFWLDEGISHYMVRFRPDEAGTWTFSYDVLVNDTVVQTDNGSLVVNEASALTNGYIGINQTSKRNFVFDSGKTYFPNGANFGWWATSLGTYDYYNWFKALEETGGNYARIWMSNRAFSIHRDSYTNFDSTQNIAIRLDSLFEFAEEYGVYVMLTLINHGQFSATTNPNWGINPYNSANGGMLDLPIQFFYNGEARTAYKNELLYLIARYGHSENLFAWELFNEVDWVDGYNSGIVTRWHSEMALFIKANDPYGHLVTTSYKSPSGTDAYLLNSLDFCAAHSYEYYDKPYYPKLLQEMDAMAAKYDKPVFFGEIGIDWRNGSGTYGKDPTGITLHQGLWGGIMGGSGGAMQWWWDSWIDLYDLWYRFEGIGSYIKLMDLGEAAYQNLRTMDGVSISNAMAGLMGYATETDVFGYLYHRQWNYYSPNPDPVSGIEITLPIDNGDYYLTFYDTITGTVTYSTSIAVTAGTLEFTVIT
ncbi:MAG: hypothetical protein PHI01_03115, partial [Candidatus Izemoplasmatales bacterium]|nr:hypothetical protein [Candidatus Izemoplasmatales bacterium]